MNELFSTTPKESVRFSNVPLCGSCNLHKQCISPKMKPTGQGRRKILIVAEAPGEQEDQEGTQLIGVSGQILRNILKRNKVDLDRDCWKTNAVICRPKKNKIPSDKIVQACFPNLWKTIKTLKPNVIILLGTVAVKSLVGTLRNETISSQEPWVGWTIPCQSLNTWICPTYHPAYVLYKRNQPVEKFLEQHLQKAIKLANSRPWGVVPDYRKDVEVIENTRQASLVLEEFLKSKKPIAIDIETNCLKPEYERSEIYSCSVCSNGTRTIAYPWSGDVIDSTIQLLKSPIKKIAQNIKFEDRWFRNKLGIKVNKWFWDTMIATHIIDSRPKITGLKFQAFVQLGQNTYNDKVEDLLTVKNKNNHINRIDEIPFHELLLYNGLDSLLTYKIAKLQLKRFRNNG